MQKTQEEILDDFARGRECAEQVCMMLAGRLGDDADTLRRSAVAFGSGMGCAETCGCITAAMLILGARYAARAGSDDATVMDAGLVLADKREAFLKRFLAAHGGALTCKTLLGHDIFAPGGRAAAIQEGKFASVCAPLVNATAAELAKLL
ncbi:C-GCAxxG-C-C family protein [Desulfobulbus oralis]|uniref:C_GCAxxG_C_C family protein n=1 Tax=Desulfobulbus oralis TaxID=1986146 RepID=A0A2L1GLU4_9BACT|nr:C-GCAxxG-C-C family protein [Desulfobulbus oralis]AVD70624.1 hypothetical protein CAY53_03255 [Desulfobulbus oralis]